MSKPALRILVTSPPVLYSVTAARPLMAAFHLTAMAFRLVRSSRTVARLYRGKGRLFTGVQRGHRAARGVQRGERLLYGGGAAMHRQQRRLHSAKAQA
jgi:hypothetical protein